VQTLHRAPEFLTATEVIDRLTRLPARLRRLAAACVLPAVRVGDEWRFRRADLDAWIEQAEEGDRAAGLPNGRSPDDDTLVHTS
jgi:excisionase family DNA binding protein